MAFIVETGSGTPGANAYASAAFVLGYLTERGRASENDWSVKTLAEQQGLIIQATDFIEARWGQRFKGSKALDMVDGREASAGLTLSVLPLNGSTLTVGQKTYRLVNTLAQENDVLIGSDIAATIVNLVLAFDMAQGVGTVVEAHTQPNYEATGVDQSPQLAVVARTPGESGNLIAFTTTIAGATITGAGFLVDGLDEGEQPLSFPRTHLYTRDGRPVIGVPSKLKQATAEYAVRAAAAPLAPDPLGDATLVPIISKTEIVDVIEESTTYAAGAQPVLLKPYPAADRLLAEYVTSAGGAVRA